MFSIGEFSKATALTIKTLRLYHERELLVPTYVDPATGYRYYDRSCLERARIIKLLRELQFSLDDVHDIVATCSDDADALEFIEAHRHEIQAKLAQYQRIADSLDHILRVERAARQARPGAAQIEDRTIAPQLVAAIRITGRYDQSGENFRRLGRAFGLGLAGKPGNLFYDPEYKEADADFESFFPIKRRKTVEGIDVRELAGGRFLTLVHHGPYDTIHHTYALLFETAEREGLVAGVPSREIYIKGPGMIFRGNPTRYLTEVQVPVGPAPGVR